MTYVQGLKDLGGALEYGANLTEDLIDAWDTLMEAYDTAVEGGKQVWFAVVHPKLTNATYFVGTPWEQVISEENGVPDSGLSLSLSDKKTKIRKNAGINSIIFTNII